MLWFVSGPLYMYGQWITSTAMLPSAFHEKASPNFSSENMDGEQPTWFTHGAIYECTCGSQIAAARFLSANT